MSKKNTKTQDFGKTTEKENEMQDDNFDDFYEPYSEYGEEFEGEPIFEKTNRQTGVRKVRD